MNTCIYLRKSRKGDDQNETPAETLRRHREQLLALAEKMELCVINIKEEIMSGDSIASRPAMQELLEEVAEGKYDAVLVMDIDRLGRGSMIDQGIISRTFRESETLVITPDKTYDLSDDLDEDFYDLYAFFARKELKQIKKRLQRGKIKSLKEGNFVWSKAPFGYVKSSPTKIVPHPENAPIVKNIFSWYLSGISMGKIAAMLNEAGISTSLGCSWTHKSVSSILRNGEYTGDIIIGRTKLIRGKAEKQPESAWITVPGKHEPIISKQVFLQVQQKLSAGKTVCVKSDTAIKNPLSGILFCGFCGAAMTRKSYGSQSARLRCSRSCPDTKSSRLKETEDRLLDLILSCLSPRINEFCPTFREVYTDDQASSLSASLSAALPYEISPSAALRKNLETRAKKISVQLSRQHDLLEQGIYDENTFLRRRSQLMEEKEALEKKIEALQEKQKYDDEKNEKPSADCPQRSISESAELYDSFQNKKYSGADLLKAALATADIKSKNDLLKAVVSRAEYYRRKTDQSGTFCLTVILKL